MQIKSIRVFRRDLALTKPYTIAYQTISAVENIFLVVELANGIIGLGAANPSPEVVDESPDQAFENLQSDAIQRFVGRDIRHTFQLIDEASQHFPNGPGTLAAFDIALHDAFGQFLGIPVVELYGQKITALPTSVTIGIMPIAETLEAARDYMEQGFRVLKVKTGLDVSEDIGRIRKLREQFGPDLVLRVDANQGYSVDQLIQFIGQTDDSRVELIEQPLPAGADDELRALPLAIRRTLAADESLKGGEAALKLAQEPKPFGIFNIKLMKCGGIRGAFDIATVARLSQIELFWGCNDESIVSISAALHAAFACPNTRYIDLDGSFDLAEDVVKGGFTVKDGLLYPTGTPGLGLTDFSF
ncbi:mandelate racemase/muconate lactonizing enzyme family protein [Larkinella terrae]|uniref:Dipeptide epimerase n=1 Tax=Larkinella terrae TaxID=2025311 RepID=A0A7K0EI55_9BACT|nr:dipeptide epimerase [Larkinella terrae]MRS61519.1 dipeptide epimerase [Larkinella terrae]